VLGLPVFAQVRGERGLLAWRKVGEFRKDLKCEGRSVPGGNWLPDVVARGSLVADPVGDTADDKALRRVVHPDAE